MSNWAASGAVKIERAKEHIERLDSDITSFRLAHPYTSIVEGDDQGYWVFRAVIDVEPPPLFGGIAGDAIHNLRSSLDLLWKHAYTGGEWNRDRKDSFPFFESNAELEARLERETPGRHRSALIGLRGANPYKNDASGLWSLHALDLAEKHHVLVPVCSAVWFRTEDPTAYFRQSHLHRIGHSLSPVALRRQLELPVFPVHNGTELFRMPVNQDGPQQDMNQTFLFEVAFGDEEPVQGEPIVATLRHFAQLVDALVDTFLSEGLVR